MKTIFFTLYPMNTFRNLLMVPGGVFDRLRGEKDVRIVLLIAPGSERILHARHEAKLTGTNVVLEQVVKITPKSAFQRLFYFFYSYLIFTSTTKTLATWGVRTDAPPAGGRRYFAFPKWLIAHTFGRSRFVKTRFVPWMYERLFTARPYRALFDRYASDLVFLSNVAHFPDQEILAEAKRRGIRTVGMASNWDHFNKYFVPLRADALLAQNELIRREAIEYQAYLPEQVTVVGFPQFDLYAHIEQYTSSKESFFARLGIPGRAKLILFIAGSVHYAGEPGLVRQIVRWIDEGRFGSGAYLFIRLYPGTDKSAFQEVDGHPRVLFDVPPTLTTVEGFGYFLDQLRHADLVISIYSTTLLEAAILDVPLITIGFDGEEQLPFHKSIRRAERMAHIRHLIEDGYVRIVRSFGELEECIARFLVNPGSDRENREKLVRKMCGDFDGNASERITQIILTQCFSR